MVKFICLKGSQRKPRTREGGWRFVSPRFFSSSSLISLKMLLLLKRVPGILVIATRGKLRPPVGIPFRGIYRTDGETVRKDELIVVQKKLNYHPGANVSRLLCISSFYCFRFVVYTTEETTC